MKIKYIATTSLLLVLVISLSAVSAQPHGYGTFIGTAKPTRFEGRTVVYMSSTMVPSQWNTLTWGYFVSYTLRGLTLDQLTVLATDYYIQTSGGCGVGSPRFSIAMSNGKQVHVYVGTAPNFVDGPTEQWLSTGNLVTDPDLRWDSSQLGGPWYGTYSQAVALANAQGLTIDCIFLGVDGGWVYDQTILFSNIQINEVIRFPA